MSIDLIMQILQSGRLPVALISLLALCATSCRSPDGLTRSSRLDSLQTARKSVLALLPVPPSTARVKIPVHWLSELPVNAGYSSSEGQATVDVRRTEDGGIEVTATCDSLARQVILMEEELTRIRSETGVEEKPPEAVRQPTGWQWFQIWTGRIAVALLVLMVLKRRLNKNKM